MDPREQINDRTESLAAMLDGRQSKIWTVLPGIVQSFNDAEMTCTVQIAIGFTQIDSDGAQIPTTIKGGLVDCPVQFPSGGDFTLTFWPEQGDECEVRFSARCFDAWWQSGGVQPQQEFRMHDLSDGFVTVGVWSKPNVLTSIKRHATQLRNKAGDAYYELNSDKIAKIVAPGGINLNGVTIDSSGNLHAPGEVVRGFGTGDQVTLGGHEHPTAGTGAPSPPTPGT